MNQVKHPSVLKEVARSLINLIIVAWMQSEVLPDAVYYMQHSFFPEISGQRFGCAAVCSRGSVGCRC